MEIFTTSETIVRSLPTKNKTYISCTIPIPSLNEVLLKVLLKVFYQNLFNYFLSIPNYPHYLRLIKSIYQHLFKIFFFQTTLTTSDLLKLYYQHFFNFFYQFQTSLTTTDFLKSFYQHLFKNFI